MNNILSFVRKLVPSTAHRLSCYNFTCKRLYSDVVQSIQENSDYNPPSYVKLPPRTGKRNKQNFEYFLVLDFESTCDAPKNVVPQEIIEFPVLKVNGETFETESIFHSYVRPVINPELTKFCTRLTGITQENIDKQPVFEDVYEDFQNWMHAENILKEGTRFAFITCGDWDLKYIIWMFSLVLGSSAIYSLTLINPRRIRLLSNPRWLASLAVRFPIQCKGLRIPVPDYMKRWINVKFSFESLSSTYPRNMVTMLKYSSLEPEGNLHSGIDDCKNIARLVKDLADRGIVYDFNTGGRC